MATSYGPMGNPFTSRGGAAVNGARSAMGFGPGPAAPGFDNTGANAALEPYGLREPDTFSQPGPAENTAWGTNHPRAGRAIDNALIAMGGMGPTSESAGDNISNVARGVMGIEPFRRQYASEQAMMPFQYAKEIGGLQAQQSYMKMQNAMGAYYGDRGQAAKDANDYKLQAATIRANIQGAMKPRLAKDANGEYVETPQVGEDFQTTWQRTNIDPTEFKKSEAKGRMAGRFGNSASMEYAGESLASHYGGWDKIPETLDPAGLKVMLNSARAASPQIYDASLSRTQHQDDLFQKDQQALIIKGMPKSDISAEDQKSIDDASKAMPPSQRRAWVKDQLAAKKAEILKSHDEYLMHSFQYSAMQPDQQKQVGGFYGFLQQQGAVQAPPPQASSSPTPGGAPQLSDTINQMMGLLAKPKVQAPPR